MQEVPVAWGPVDPAAVLPEDVQVVGLAQHICAARAALQEQNPLSCWIPQPLLQYAEACSAKLKDHAAATDRWPHALGGIAGL